MSRYVDISELEMPEHDSCYADLEVFVETVCESEYIDICFCRECKYWHSNTQFCDKWSHGGFISQRTLPNDFCSCGSRSEKPNNSEIPTGSVRRAPITALELALSECKARHNGCENCTTECAWKE